MDNKELFDTVASQRTALTASGIYVGLVFLYRATLQNYPHPKKATKSGKMRTVYPAWIRPVSVLHNLLLACLSLAMFLGMSTSFYKVCQEEGFDNCMDLHKTGKELRPDMWTKGPAAFWMFCFMASKYYEFVDTFIMMGKRYDLIVLHWWHHASVPFLCSIHYMDHTASAWTGSAFNCFVHTVMYSYYAWVAAGFSFPAKSLITSLQLMQFVTVLGHVGYLNYVHGWDFFANTFTFAYTIYNSYLILFAKFFMDNYTNKSKKLAKKIE